MISVCFQTKPFNITVIQLCALTRNAEEADVERFYEDLQDLLELTPQNYVLFIIGDWNAKVGSQETLGVTGKFGLGMRNADEFEAECVCEDLQDLLELTFKKDVIFIIGDWNVKVGSQETPGVTE